MCRLPPGAGTVGEEGTARKGDVLPRGLDEVFAGDDSEGFVTGSEYDLPGTWCGTVADGTRAEELRPTFPLLLSARSSGGTGGRGGSLPLGTFGNRGVIDCIDAGVVADERTGAAGNAGCGKSSPSAFWIPGTCSGGSGGSTEGDPVLDRGDV